MIHNLVLRGRRMSLYKNYSIVLSAWQCHLSLLRRHLLYLLYYYHYCYCFYCCDNGSHNSISFEKSKPTGRTQHLRSRKYKIFVKATTKSEKDRKDNVFLAGVLKANVVQLLLEISPSKRKMKNVLRNLGAFYVTKVSTISKLLRLLVQKPDMDIIEQFLL